MKKKNDRAADAELRRQAEMKLSERKKKATPPSTTEADTRRLVHELEVHQIELEMQNEELLQSRAQVEAGLRQYTDLYDFAPVGYFTLARDGAIHLVNLAGANLLGVERGALIKRRFGVFVSARSRTTFNTFLEKVFGSQQKETCEVALQKDGAVPMWVHMEAITEDGQREVARAVVVDITDRKLAEEELQKLSSTVEQTADSIVITNKDGIIEYVNPAFERLTGYTKEEVLGKTPRILKSGRHSESFYKDFWENILAGNTYRTKFINCKKNGELYIIEKTATPIKNESGEITHFISTDRDVTEKERIEDELYKNSRILQSFIQYSITPFVLLDKDFNFLQVNDAYAKACQRDISEFMGHNHFEFYPSDVKADFEKVVNTKKAVRFVERPFVFPDHPEWEVTYWDWGLTPILDKMGEVEFLVFALRDVTQRKKGIDEVRKSHEQLRALYSHLQNAREEERTRIAREIHDSIGQSLTGLKMDLSFLENEMAQQEDLRARNKLYGKIQSMYILLDEMIQSVRDVSAQLRPLILDSLGLVTAIEWQTEEFQKKTGLTCEYVLPKETVELNSAESTVLFRIFQECFTNIIRHAKATKVSIKLERKENHILLEVQDNGIGISENVVKDIKSLGLLGMKERALVFGGSVDIHGNPGKGTTVTVKILH